jgi:hypothetical protein
MYKAVYGSIKTLKYEHDIVTYTGHPEEDTRYPALTVDGGPRQL